MSKLNKYKKPPAIKLPAPPKKTTSAKSKKIFEVSSDSEDDDFQKPRSKEFAAPARQKKNKSDEQNNIQIHITNSKQIKGADGGGISRKEKSQSKSITSTTTNDYFFVPDDKKKYITDKNKNPEDDILSDEESPVGQPKKRSCKPELPIPNTNGKKDNKVHTTEENGQEGNTDAELKSVSTKVAHPPEAVCPFCWKHLTDKLAGSVHIKACAKNLPLNQIFEALQLQEKQIKEWEGLGIAYPGFGGPSSSAAGSRRGGLANSKTGNKASRPTRRKKQDPELELAIALSESLHEEVERRKQSENVFIVENDLQGEIEIRPAIQVPNIKTESKPSKAASKTVKRGKRGNLALLPLCTASDSEKKSEIEKRLGMILDESETNSNKHEEFNIRENPNHNLLQLSQRLENYKIEASPLWSLASSASSFDAPETYSISAVSDAKSRLILELGNSVQADRGSPEKVHTTSNTRSTQPNFVVPEVKIVSNPSQLQNNKCEITPTKVITVDALNSNNNLKSSSFTPLLAKLSNDLLHIFVNKEMTDLTVYGREEKPIKAHKLIIMARCRKLYSEIVQENTSNGKTVRDIISLTCFSHLAVKAFVKFLYCGKLKPLEGQDFLDLMELGSRYCIQLTDVVVTTSTTTTTTNSVKPDILVEEKQRSTPQLITPTQCDLPIPKCTTRESVGLDQQHCVELMSTSITKPSPNCQLRESCNRNRSAMSLDLFLDEEDELKTETNFLASKKDMSLQQQSVQEFMLDNQNDKDDDDDDDARSRDMFEDLEDFEEEHVIELKISSADQLNPVSTKHKSSDIDDDNSKIIIDDELNPVKDSQHRVLLSPKHCKSSSQDLASLFPSCYNFTASQVAGYIDFISSLRREESQANKKHKLIDIEEIDDDNVVLNMYCDSSSVVNLDQSCGTSKKTFKKLKKDSSISSFQREIVTVHENHVTSTLSECNNSLQLFPLNSYHDPCVSPEQDGQSPSCVERVELIKENVEDDPFGNDDDDCFLNLPSVLFQNPSPLPPCPSLISNKKSKSAVPQSDLFPIPSRSNTDKFSQNLELNCQNSFDGKGKAGKSNNGRKNQRQKRALSQEPTPTRKVTPSTPKRPSAQPKSNLMNYSTIDTPILKKELKRYGLKPMPRSKAKLILRHIDEQIQQR